MGVPAASALPCPDLRAPSAEPRRTCPSRSAPAGRHDAALVPAAVNPARGIDSGATIILNTPGKTPDDPLRAGRPSTLRRLLGSRAGVGAGVLAISALAFATFHHETVNVALVEEGPLRQAIVASGRVRTPERIVVSAQIAGRVQAVEVREGDALAPGQALLRLDEREWGAAVAQAGAAVVQGEARLRQLRELGLPVAEQALRQAEATALQAQRHHRRVQELVARGFYSQAQLDEARRALDVADSQVRSARLQRASQQPGGSEIELARSALEQARAALAAAETRLSYATLRAPVAGTVLTRNVEAGDTVQPGTPLMTIAPAGATELTVQIDEKNLALLHPGQAALASADAYPGERFAAVLAYIAPSVDAQRGSVEVRLRVPEPPPYLRHEMTVSLDIEAARRERTLAVPAAAVRESGGAQPWVLVVRDGRTARQPVRLGIRGAGRVEVLEGLAAGEAVVPAPADVPAGRAVRTRVQP